MTLQGKQFLFAASLPELISHARAQGFQVTLGEAWRSDETAALYEKEGKGVSNSLHRLRLAIDINLFKNGVYLTDTSDYAEIGKYWESLSAPDAEYCWGGNFNDGNHFSIEHDGVR